MWLLPLHRRLAVSLDDPERGSAPIIVTTFGMLAAMVALTLCKYLVVEYRATEDSMASIRAYWAARGVETYVLSRTLQAGACGNSGNGNGNCDNAQQLSREQGYLAEIQSSGSVTWQYPELGSAYRFSVATVTSIDPKAPTSGTVGDLMMRSTFATATTKPESLRSIVSVRPVEFGYCLVSSVSSGCGGGPGGNSNSWPRITYVHRPGS